MNDIFPKIAKNSGTNVTFDLWFEDFLLSQPLFFDRFETFWSLDPSGECCVFDENQPIIAGDDLHIRGPSEAGSYKDHRKNSP